MKSLKSLTLPVFTVVSGLVFGQEKIVSEPSTKTLPNGIVIHEAVGVEGKVTQTTETPVIANNIENWNADQIKEVIEYIQVKIKENCSTKEYVNYEEQLKSLEERLKVIEGIKQ